MYTNILLIKKGIKQSAQQSYKVTLLSTNDYYNLLKIFFYKLYIIPYFTYLYKKEQLFTCV